MDLDLLEWGVVSADRGSSRAMDAQERSSPGYEDVIISALRRIALRQETVHYNDLYEDIFKNGLVRRPTNPNCMGGIWKRCSHPDTGFLIMTNTTIRVTDPVKKGHRNQVYRSLICKSRVSA